MDPLSLKTVELFKKNKLAGHFNYVRSGEVVPHFFSRGSYFLSRDEDNYELRGTVNSCLHRGFKLISQRTQMKPNQSIGCKFHNWSYNQNGMLLSTPGFDKPINGCLQNVELIDIHQGLYFETETLSSLTSIKELFTAPHLKNLQLEDFSFDQENVTFYPCNWETFMEVYLDTYHYKHAHLAGLGTFLTDKVDWYSSEEGIVNIVEIAPKDTVIKSFGWSKFNEELQKVGWNKQWGAIFVTVFPGFMIEFFPHVMVISQLVPISDKMTANYLQIYYDSKVKENFDFQNAFGDAYSETASEDNALRELLEDGRTGKWYEISTMPVHTVMEAGIPLLKTWMSRNCK